MTVTVKHPFVSAIPDSADTSLVRPSNWNADHTIIGLGTAAEKDVGVANGVASLDSGGKVPVSELPAAVLGALSYQGTWNASTNTPTLASGVGTKGYYYVVSVAGSTNLDGITSWVVGDWAVYNGTAWQKVDNTDAVTSVNGYTGTVVLNANDVGAQPAGTYVTSVGATAPVASSGGTTPTISMAAANTTTDGYLTSTDWNTFNNKTSNTGTVTSVGITAGSAIVVSGSPITTSGNMTVGVSTKLAAINSLSGAGFFTQNGSGAIAGRTIQAGTGINVQHGNGSSQDPVISNTGVLSVSGTAPVVSSGGTTPAISMAAATSSVNGYLTSADWTTFNNKGSGSVTSVAASVPSFLSVAGSPITTSGTIAISYSGTALPVANGGTGVTSVGTAGNVLTSNGTAWVSSAPVSSNITAQGLFENANTISANYTIGTNNNAVSAGPITVASGFTVTVPSGSVWTIV
jgi:hypothetical protein